MFKIEIGENNPILRTPAQKVLDRDFNKAVQLGKKMLKYIKNPKNGGVGLAAPQIGVGINLVIVSLLNDWDDEAFKTIMLINPEILEYSKETSIEEEGCLSLPGVKGNVERPIKIKLSYQDEKKSKKVIILEGLQARIVQHEVDHINGKLFIDYIK